jgi:hypothetical protein
LVDIYELEQAGYKVEDAVFAASLKDTGLTSAQLGWVLNQIKFGDDAVIPSKIKVEELRKYLDNLIERLTVISFPK